MTKKEILVGYVNSPCPGLTGYAYQATTWCEDCGQRIARDIVRTWEKRGRLSEITHHDLCDTDQFPVPITYEPTDFCDQCGPMDTNAE